MSVTLNKGSSLLWIENGIVLPQKCQGGPCRRIPPSVISSQCLFDISCKIKEVEESLKNYTSLSPEVSKKLQEDIQKLNKEISEKKIEKFFSKLRELKEKNLWSCISVDVSCLKNSLSNYEKGGKGQFLLTYQKLNHFFNRQDASNVKSEQLALITTFHQISNEFTEIKKKNLQQFWKDVKEDLESLEGSFPTCQGEEKNAVLTLYEQLNNFFNQLDRSILDFEQRTLWDRFEQLGKQNQKLIEEHQLNIDLTEEALSSLTSFEFYLNDFSDQSLSQEALNLIIFDYTAVVERIKKQSFFICPEVLHNVNNRLGAIQKRLDSFEASKSPTSVSFGEYL